MSRNEGSPFADMFKKLTEAESEYNGAMFDYRHAPRGNDLIDAEIVAALQRAEGAYKDVLAHSVGVLASMLKDVTTTPDHLER